MVYANFLCIGVVMQQNFFGALLVSTDNKFRYKCPISACSYEIVDVKTNSS